MPNILADRVLESSVSAGTGVLTLAGAVLGFRAFSAVCAVTDTMPYYIEAVDALGRPTGEWEYGLGTYSAANQLTRTTIRGSSNAGLAVAFSAGTKLVGLGIAAPNSAATRLEWRDALSVYSAAQVDAAITVSLTPAASVTVAGKVELATDAEAQAGTDATRAVTPDNLGATVLGLGQTWQNVIGSRAASTNYTNSTGRAIVVSVSANSAYTPGSASMTLTVAGVVVASRSTNESSGASYQGSNGQLTGIVPNGAAYRVDGITGGLSISHWAELRS